MLKLDWISDIRSQGCTGLQSLIICLDHEGAYIVAQSGSAVMQGRVRLRDAMKCISEAVLQSYDACQIESLTCKLLNNIRSVCC